MTLKLIFEPAASSRPKPWASRESKGVDVIAMAIQKNATVFDLEEAELCYAPQFGVRPRTRSTWPA